MNVTQMINNEEYFTYLVSSGKSKSEAYRTVFPEHKDLTPELIAMRAWRYSNKPEVIRILSNEEDNLFVRYSNARFQALDVLLDLAQNASSEKVQADAATSLLNQTNKLKKLEVQVDMNINNEYVLVLDELRSTLLSSNSHENTTSVEHQNLVETPLLRLDGKELSIDMLDEQEFESINPLKPQDGENRVRAKDGRFVSYNEAREILEVCKLS